MRRLYLVTIMGLNVVLALLLPSGVRATEYVAFSLKVVQERLTQAKGGTSDPELLNLGGMTAVRGLVYDRERGDPILVGERDTDRPALTLDDFVVALRARFIHGQWPVVSIDPTPDTPKTDRQFVRFEGGIADTAFGQTLFEADYLLKRVGMGLIPSGVPGLKSDWDLFTEWAQRQSGRTRINSRFWFYPVLPSVTVREDVVSCTGLSVGVFTEVLGAEFDGKPIADLTTFQHEPSDQFAKGVTEHYLALSRAHPVLARLQGLLELVALAHALEGVDQRPDLTFWLSGYRTKPVATPKEIPVLRRTEQDKSRYRESFGGVQLMALATRLKAGDVTALKEAVLKIRPEPLTMVWSFVVGEWIVPTGPDMLQMEDVAPLFSHAAFLKTHGRYQEAISLYSKIIALRPDCELAYNNRAYVYRLAGKYEQAIEDFNTAIRINPTYSQAYNNRAGIFIYQGQYNEALTDLARALELNPFYAAAYNNRGAVYYNQGRYAHAIEDLSRAIGLTPSFSESYNNRGLVYSARGQYDQALWDYTKAIEFDPKNDEAYVNRGSAYLERGEFVLANADFNTAIRINPLSARAYNNRGVISYRSSQYEPAIADYTKAIEISPKQGKYYINRAGAYYHIGQYGLAIDDLNRAAHISPMDAEAYYLKALIYERSGRFGEARDAYTDFVRYAPPWMLPQVEYARERIMELSGR